MKSISSLKANVIYNLLYQLLALIVPLITAPYISRVIGVDGLGIYGYTFSISHYFVVFIMLGILNYGNREISVFREDEKLKSDTFWNIYLNQFIMGILVTCLYLIFIFFFCPEFNSIFLIQIFYILSGVLDISWFYFGIEKYKFTTSVSCLNKVLSTVCIFLFVKTPEDLTIYTLIIALSAFLNNSIYWIFLPKKINSFSFSFVKALNHIKPILILFLPVIAINIYRYISKIMLGSMSAISEVGLYDAAEKFVNLPLSFIAAVGTVMLSRVSNLTAVNDVTNIKKYNYLSMLFVMIVGIGVTFGLFGISDEFIPFFYGYEFSKSSTILNCLLPTILFISWSNVIRNQYLLPNRKDFLYCVSVFVGALINVCVNLILIPKYGAIGAAFSTTIAEFSVCLIQSIIAFKYMELQLYASRTVPYLVIGFVMYIIISHFSLSSSFYSLALKIIVGAVVYLSLSGLYFRYVQKYHI